jgi:ParB/RepB/Spo0J family partition protein
MNIDFTDTPLFPDLPSAALEIFQKPEVVRPSDVTLHITRSVVMLHTDQIEPREKFRSVENSDEFDNLVENIKLNGQLDPITVCQISDDFYVVVRGNRRLKAVQSLGHRFIEARVLGGSGNAGSELNDLYEIISDEHHRKTFSALDKAELIRDIVLLESGATVAEIRSAINRHSNAHRILAGALLSDDPILDALRRAVEKIGIRPETYRTEYWPLCELEPDLKEALREVPKSIVLELRQVDDVSQRKKILDEICAQPKLLSVRAARDLIRGTPKTKSTKLEKNRHEQAMQDPGATVTTIGRYPLLAEDWAGGLVPTAVAIDVLVQSQQLSENNQRATDAIRDALKILRNALENGIEFDWAYARISKEESHE